MGGDGPYTFDELVGIPEYSSLNNPSRYKIVFTPTFYGVTTVTKTDVGEIVEFNYITNVSLHNNLIPKGEKEYYKRRMNDEGDIYNE